MLGSICLHSASADIPWASTRFHTVPGIWYQVYIVRFHQLKGTQRNNIHAYLNTLVINNKKAHLQLVLKTDIYWWNNRRVQGFRNMDLGAQIRDIRTIPRSGKTIQERYISHSSFPLNLVIFPNIDCPFCLSIFFLCWVCVSSSAMWTLGMKEQAFITNIHH